MRRFFIPLLCTVTLAACGEKAVSVTTFEECAALGNEVMDGNPRQCKTADGKIFAEQNAQPAEPEPTQVKTQSIEIDTPLSNDAVQGTFVVTGKAKGWFFEGSFPVTLFDAQNSAIVQTKAEAVGEWMTEDWVEFTATIDIPVGTQAQEGTLELKKDNPSGEAENDEEILIDLQIAG